MNIVQNLLEKYLTSGHESVEGWFYPLDMLLFQILNVAQKNTAINGDICELGVYKAKSLILLALLAEEHESLIAMDLFYGDLLDQSQLNVRTHTNQEIQSKIRWIVGDSSGYSVENLREVFREPVRLLHIDAGHEYHEVLQSLYAFAPFVDNAGIIIMDDYQDRDFPGIESAVYKFTQSYSPRRFVPFLAGGNKMYLCQPAFSAYYQKAVIESQNLENQCLLSKIDDYFVLIAASKLPMQNSQIESILRNQFIPYEYPVDMDALRRNAKQFGQLQDTFGHDDAVKK